MKLVSSVLTEFRLLTLILYTFVQFKSGEQEFLFKDFKAMCTPAMTE